MAEDLDLPGAGWGLARLRGAITSPGTRYSGNGSTREEKGLKHRPAESVREVPLPPDLVDRLRWHLERYAREGGRVFTNSRGESVTADNYGPVWVKARGRTWPGRHALSETTVYDPRHTAATTMLRAGVIPSEVARRLGHSVDVLMRIYAGVFEDERERSNALIETELATQRKGPAGGVKTAS
jgi:integrase